MDLCNIAAECIGNLVGGADNDGRLVDAQIAVQPSRQFGSMAACRLMVPVEDILEWATAGQVLGALAAARSESGDSADWQELLKLGKLKDHLKKKNIDDFPVEEVPTIKSSVRYFIDTVAEIAECDPDGRDASKVNQMLGRFKEEHAARVNEFNSMKEEMDGTTKADARVSACADLIDWVNDQVAGLVDQRATEALKFWEAPDDGLKVLLDKVAETFVDKSAFGLLKAWMAELARQVEEQKQSLDDNERRDHADEDTVRTAGEFADETGVEIQTLRTEAGGFMARFRKQKFFTAADTLSSDASDNFTTMLWHAELEAADAIYDRATGHSMKLIKAAAGVADKLGNSRITNQFKKSYKNIADALDVNIKGEKDSQGASTVFYIGGDANDRKRIEEEISENSAPAQLLSATIEDKANKNKRKADMPGLARALFHKELGDDATDYGPAAAEQEEAKQNKKRGLSTQEKSGSDPDRVYADTLRKYVLENIKQVVNDNCQIDELFEKQAREVCDEFYSVLVEDPDNADHDEKIRVRALLADLGPDLEKWLRKQPFEQNRDLATEKSMPKIMGLKLYKYMAFCSPQWSLKPNPYEEGLMLRYAFVTFPAKCTKFSKALKIVETTEVDPNREKFKAQSSDSMDARMVNFCVMEVGARMESLAMSQGLADYEWAMERESFSPHNNRFDRMIGESYLKAQEDQPVGGPLLELAEEFGVFSATKGGNYKWNRAVAAGDGYDAIESGSGVGKGYESVTSLLEDNGEEEKNTRNALKAEIWRDILHAVKGEDGIGGIGWDAMAARIEKRASGMRKQIKAKRGSGDHAYAETLETSKTGLDNLAKHLKELNDDPMPNLFS